MKLAHDLAAKHRAELLASQDLPDSEYADLVEQLDNEFRSVRGQLGEMQKSEFALAYQATLNPVETPASAPDPTAEASPSPVACSKCGSTQFGSHTKSFSVRNALIGGFVFGGVGLLGGFVGSPAVRITCFACGHAWDAGKA